MSGKKKSSQLSKIKLELSSYDDLNQAVRSLDNTSFRESLDEEALDDDYTSKADSSNTPASRRIIYQRPQTPQRNNEFSQELPIVQSKRNEDSSKKDGQDFSFSQMELENIYHGKVRIADSKERVSTHELESAGNFGLHVK